MSNTSTIISEQHPAEHLASKRKQSISDALIAFGCQIGGQASKWLATGLLTHFATRSDFGEYIWAMSAATFLSVPVALGMPTTLVKFLPIYRQNQDWNKYVGLTFTANAIAIVLGILLAIAGSVALNVIKFERLPISVHILTLAFWIIPLMAASTVTMQAHRMLSGMATLALPNILVPGLTAIFLICARFAGMPFTAFNVVLLSLTAYFLTLTIQLCFFQNDFRKVGHGFVFPGKQQIAEWLSPSLPIAYTLTLTALLSQLDLLIAGLLLPIRVVAVYGLASRLSQLIGFAMSSVHTAVGPQLSVAHVDKDSRSLRSIFFSAVKWTTIPASVVALILFVGGHQILALFGPGYASAYIPMVILIVGYLVNVACGPIMLFLNVSGMERKLPLVCVVATAIESGLIYLLVLVRHFGTVGIAIGSAVGMVIVNIWSLQLAAVSLRHTDDATLQVQLSEADLAR